MQYDLTVTLNEEGYAVLHPETQAGKEFIHTLDKDIEFGSDVIIDVNPDEFEAAVPHGLRVGYVCPESGQVVQMSKKCLH